MDKNKIQSASELIRVARAHPDSVVLQKEVHQAVSKGESFFSDAQEYQTLKNIDEHLDANYFIGSAAPKFEIEPGGLWGMPPPEAAPAMGPGGWWILGGLLITAGFKWLEHHRQEKALQQNPLVDPQRELLPDPTPVIRMSADPDPVAPANADEKVEPEEPAEESSEKRDPRYWRNRFDRFVAFSMYDLDELSPEDLQVRGNLQRIFIGSLLRELGEVMTAMPAADRAPLELIRNEIKSSADFIALSMAVHSASNDNFQDALIWFREAERVVQEAQSFFGKESELHQTMRRHLGIIREQYLRNIALRYSKSPELITIEDIASMQALAPILGNAEEHWMALTTLLGHAKEKNSDPTLRAAAQSARDRINEVQMERVARQYEALPLSEIWTRLKEIDIDRKQPQTIELICTILLRAHSEGEFDDYWEQLMTHPALRVRGFALQQVNTSGRKGHLLVESEWSHQREAIEEALISSDLKVQYDVILFLGFFAQRNVAAAKTLLTNIATSDLLSEEAQAEAARQWNQVFPESD